MFQGMEKGLSMSKKAINDTTSAINDAATATTKAINDTTAATTSGAKKVRRGSIFKNSARDLEVEKKQQQASLKSHMASLAAAEKQAPAPVAAPVAQIDSRTGLLEATFSNRGPIGIIWSADGLPAGKVASVKRIKPGSVAAGVPEIALGMYLQSVAGRSVAGLTYAQVVAMIRGAPPAPASVVKSNRMLIQPVLCTGETRPLTLVMEPPPLPTVALAELRQFAETKMSKPGPLGFRFKNGPGMTGCELKSTNDGSQAAEACQSTKIVSGAVLHAMRANDHEMPILLAGMVYPDIMKLVRAAGRPLSLWFSVPPPKNVVATFGQPGPLGLKFTPYTEKQTAILAINPGTQAEQHVQLRPGLVLAKVAGMPVQHQMSYRDVLTLVKGSVRPLELEFCVEPVQLTAVQPQPQPSKQPAPDATPGGQKSRLLELQQQDEVDVKRTESTESTVRPRASVLELHRHEEAEVQATLVLHQPQPQLQQHDQLELHRHEEADQLLADTAPIAAIGWGSRDGGTNREMAVASKGAVAEHEAAMAAAKEVHEERLSAATTSEAALATAHETQTAALVAASEEKLSAAVTAHDSAAAAHDQSIAELSESHTAALSEVHGQHAEVCAEWERQHKALASEHADSTTLMEKEYQAAVSKVLAEQKHALQRKEGPRLAALRAQLREKDAALEEVAAALKQHKTEATKMRKQLTLQSETVTEMRDALPAAQEVRELRRELASMEDWNVQLRAALRKRVDDYLIELI